MAANPVQTTPGSASFRGDAVVLLRARSTLPALVLPKQDSGFDIGYTPDPTATSSAFNLDMVAGSTVLPVATTVLFAADGGGTSGLFRARCFCWRFRGICLLVIRVRNDHRVFVHAKVFKHGIHAFALSIGEPRHTRVVCIWVLAIDGKHGVMSQKRCCKAARRK